MRNIKMNNSTTEKRINSHFLCTYKNLILVLNKTEIINVVADN
jgi:hypothetical protein